MLVDLHLFRVTLNSLARISFAVSVGIDTLIIGRAPLPGRPAGPFPVDVIGSVEPFPMGKNP